MFANRISSSTSCSICLPETSPPSSARGLLRHRFQSCNTSPVPAGSTDCSLRTNLVDGMQSREQCVENLLQKPRTCLGKRLEGLAAGHCHHRERATTARLAPRLTLKQLLG